MQSDNQLPLDAWAQTLAQARGEQGLSLLEIARELMLSPAQLRDIESGSMQSFHGSGYYVRAVQKYAKRLGVALDPTVEALPLTDSQLGMQRISKSPRPSTSSATATLSRRHTTLENGLTVARHRSRTSRVGMTLGTILAVALAIGIYLSLEEGWPTKQVEQNIGNGQQTTLAKTAPLGATEAPVAPVAPLPLVPSEPLGNTPLAATPETTGVDSSAPSMTPPTVDAEIVIAVAPEPAPAPPAPPPPPPPNILEARFTADCWVEVRYKDGRVEQKVYNNRDILTVPIEEVVSLVFGNAQAVKAEKRGQSFDVMAFARGKNVARLSEADLQEP